MINIITRREMKFVMDNPDLSQGNIAIRKIGWEKMLSRFIFFSRNKLISYQRTKVQRQKITEAAASPVNNNFSIFRGTLSVNKFFRGSVRSPGDSSQFELIFQNPIHIISEETDNDTFEDFVMFTNFYDKTVDLDEMGMISENYMMYSNSREETGWDIVIEGKNVHIQEFMIFEAKIMKFAIQFQNFTRSRANSEGIIICFEVFQYETNRGKGAGFVNFLKIFYKSFYNFQYQLERNEAYLECWRNWFCRVIYNNLVNLGEKIIMHSNFEFVLSGKFGKKIIKKGLNCVLLNEGMKLKGGKWLIVVKFYESKLSMMIDEGSKIETVIQR
jgi:hypothetical protein